MTHIVRHKGKDICHMAGHRMTLNSQHASRKGEAEALALSFAHSAHAHRSLNLKRKSFASSTVHTAQTRHQSC